MTMPNFIVLGAMKAGTTALYDALRQHPEIYVARKEPEFFSYSGLNRENQSTEVYNLPDYKQLFEDVKSEKAIGDVSTTYLPSPHASLQIKKYVPNAKLIAILRNPVDRAYSHFSMLVKMGKLPSDENSFVRFFNSHVDKIDSWRTISYRGKYAEHLSRYYQNFAPEQIKIILYEDYVINYSDTIIDIFKFLNVDSDYVPINNQYWQTGNTKSRILYDINSGKLPNTIRSGIKTIFPKRILQTVRLWIDRINTERLPPLSESTRQELIEFYKSDIGELQKLINRDLSHWFHN